jgi:NAD(P)-dependent dehydrogenase (short-subunit alcohol dehydrogenase family)
MRVVLLVGMVVDSVVGVALLMATHEPFPAYAVTGRTWGDPGGGSALGWSVDVINISSVLALTTADSPQAAYAASKAGILALTRVLAQEWTGRRGIRVNAIAPGFFATEMTAGHSQHLDQLTARIPAGRLGAPDDLSGAVVFLASEASSSVTGQMIVVDGGFVIT